MSTDLQDLPLPDTAATRAAAEVVRRYAAPALVNHAERSYLWAAAYGHEHGIGFDAELLRVAASLHDLGLEGPFDSHRLPFEEAGGHLAWVFAAGAGWSEGRRDRLAQVIVRHMWDQVDPVADPEGHLLERATGFDIAGAGAHLWPEALRAEVLAALPRLDLAARFTRCFADQAVRKPDSAAAAATRAGIAIRMQTNPLEQATSRQR